MFYPKNTNFTFGIDLDLITLIFKPDLDIMKMYLHIKNEVLSSMHSKVISQKHYILYFWPWPCAHNCYWNMAYIIWRYTCIWDIKLLDQKIYNLTFEFDVDLNNIYNIDIHTWPRYYEDILHTKNEVSSVRQLKVISQKH